MKCSFRANKAKHSVATEPAFFIDVSNGDYDAWDHPYGGGYIPEEAKLNLQIYKVTHSWADENASFVELNNGD